MRTLIITLTTPDEIDPASVAEIMVDDFYYSNRATEDFGPHMEEILISWKEEEK